VQAPHAEAARVTRGTPERPPGAGLCRLGGTWADASPANLRDSTGATEGPAPRHALQNELAPGTAPSRARLSGRPRDPDCPLQANSPASVFGVPAYRGPLVSKPAGHHPRTLAVVRACPLDVWRACPLDVRRACPLDVWRVYPSLCLVVGVGRRPDRWRSVAICGSPVGLRNELAPRAAPSRERPSGRPRDLDSATTEDPEAALQNEPNVSQALASQGDTQTPRDGVPPPAGSDPALASRHCETNPMGLRLRARAGCETNPMRVLRSLTTKYNAGLRRSSRGRAGCR
jgi:hypothetical protein